MLKPLNQRLTRSQLRKRAARIEARKTATKTAIVRYPKVQLNQPFTPSLAELFGLKGFPNG